MNSTTSKSFFALVTIITIAFTFLLVFNNTLYGELAYEDNLVESLTSVFLFLSSLCFLRALLKVKKENTPYRKWLMLLFSIFSILFFWGAGEEISWGQRIFNIPTPEYLALVNDQKELNLHNINKNYFDKMVDRVTILFVIISSALFMLKKEDVIGIKTPDIYIICAFAITPFYKQGSELDWYHLVYIPLIALSIYSIINKSKQTLFALGTTLFISFLIPIVHTKYYHLFPSYNNGATECKEFLFCLCCLAYAYVIMNQTPTNKINAKS